MMRHVLGYIELLKHKLMFSFPDQQIWCQNVGLCAGHDDVFVVWLFHTPGRGNASIVNSNVLSA